MPRSCITQVAASSGQGYSTTLVLFNLRDPAHFRLELPLLNQKPYHLARVVLPRVPLKAMQSMSLEFEARISGPGNFAVSFDFFGFLPAPFSSACFERETTTSLDFNLFIYAHLNQ